MLEKLRMNACAFSNDALPQPLYDINQPILRSEAKWSLCFLGVWHPSDFPQIETPLIAVIPVSEPADKFDYAFHNISIIQYF